MVDFAIDDTSWTIKSFPVLLREAARRAAKANDQTLAEWAAVWIEKGVRTQANNGVLPPTAKRRQTMVNLPDVDLADLASVAQAAVRALEAAGEPVPKSLGKNLAATASLFARAARGIAPPARGKPRGQTLLAEGETASPVLELSEN